jgi:hypothetical protein
MGEGFEEDHFLSNGGPKPTPPTKKASLADAFLFQTQGKTTALSQPFRQRL